MFEKKIIVEQNLKKLSRRAAKIFQDCVQQTLQKQEKFSLCLSGGKTPQALYECLGQSPYQEQIPWGKIHVFWGDERGVPPNHPKSNYGMAYEALLSKINIPEAHIHRMKGELHPESAAQDYERDLRTFFGGLPTFDFILLGLGADGHTASLFPHTPVLREQNRWVVGYYAESVKMNRITLTPPVLNQGKVIVFLVSGKEKVKVIAQILKEPGGPEKYPAQLIKPKNGKLFWLLDSPAASKLGTH